MKYTDMLEGLERLTEQEAEEIPNVHRAPKAEEIRRALQTNAPAIRRQLAATEAEMFPPDAGRFELAAFSDEAVIYENARGERVTLRPAAETPLTLDVNPVQTIKLF